MVNFVWTEASNDPNLMKRKCLKCEKNTQIKKKKRTSMLSQYLCRFMIISSLIFVNNHFVVLIWILRIHLFLFGQFFFTILQKMLWTNQFKQWTLIFCFVLFVHPCLDVDNQNGKNRKMCIRKINVISLFDTNKTNAVIIPFDEVMFMKNRMRIHTKHAHTRSQT